MYISGIHNHSPLAFHTFISDFTRIVAQGFCSMAVMLCAQSMVQTLRLGKGFYSYIQIGRKIAMWCFGLWPFRIVAVSVCGRFGLWPFRFVAVPVCGPFSWGRFGLWPLWPVTYVTILLKAPPRYMAVVVSQWLSWNWRLRAGTTNRAIFLYKAACPIQCGMKLLIHSQISRVPPLRAWEWMVMLSHPLYWT